MSCKELRAKTTNELSEMSLELFKEKFNLKMQCMSGQSIAPHKLRYVRKQISRVKLVLAERKVKP